MYNDNALMQPSFVAPSSQGPRRHCLLWATGHSKFRPTAVCGGFLRRCGQRRTGPRQSCAQAAEAANSSLNSDEANLSLLQLGPQQECPKQQSNNREGRESPLQISFWKRLLLSQEILSAPDLDALLQLLLENVARCSLNEVHVACFLTKVGKSFSIHVCCMMPVARDRRT